MKSKYRMYSWVIKFQINQIKKSFNYRNTGISIVFIFQLSYVRLKLVTNIAIYVVTPRTINVTPSTSAQRDIFRLKIRSLYVLDNGNFNTFDSKYIMKYVSIFNIFSTNSKDKNKKFGGWNWLHECVNQRKQNSIDIIHARSLRWDCVTGISTEHQHSDFSGDLEFFWTWLILLICQI